MLGDLDRARDALQAIPPDLPRDEWVRAGMAAHAAGLTFDDFDAWSAGADSYEPRATSDTWRSFKDGMGIGPGTLFKMAAAHGNGAMSRSDQRPRKTATRSVERIEARRPGIVVAEVWARCRPATPAHPYIVRKKGIPDGLRVVPEGDPLRANGESLAGCLAVPVLPLAGGEPVSLQFIATPQTAAKWKAKGKKDKPNLPGASMGNGAFIVGELEPGGTAYVCEGIGQAWACWKATGRAAVVSFGWGRVRTVARELRQRDASARLVLVPDVGKEAKAEAIAREVRALIAAMPAGWEPNDDVNDYGKREGFQALEVLLSSASEPPKPAPGTADTMGMSDDGDAPLPFAVVPFADLATVEPAPPTYVWQGLVPAGFVTLLAAHGGIGKSLVALMLAVAVALGLPLFGIPTRRGIAVFYSGEDGAALLRHRLWLVCRRMGVNVDDLAGRLFILDATDDDPTLFAEVSAGGRREGVTTNTYACLRDFIATNAVSLVVVDNASDAFDAHEIDRARVRGFMRSLARIARERDAGVLLLAHVDKGTSRGDRGQNSEAYSGSTAWHNSARSRLFMHRETDGGLVLEQQKHNLGRQLEPLRLTWPEGGIPQADEPTGPVVRGIADRGHTRALLRLIAEFTARGEIISTATTTRTHAAKLLRHEPKYPKLKDGEVFDVLRRAERAGHLERVFFKGADRHERERWQVTAAGAAYADIAAATAGAAATCHDTALTAATASAAGTAATSPPGGVGETAPQEVAAGVADA